MSHRSQLENTARALGAERVDAVTESLGSIRDLGLPADLFDNFMSQLTALLPACGDVDRVVGNLQRFLHASRSPQAWLALFEREADSLATLVQLFSTSQYMANVLIGDPEAFDLLRLTGGAAVDQGVLADEIMAAVVASGDLRSAMRILRDYRHRETLRIAYGDFIAGQSVEIVTQQISNLTECIVEAALWAARREVDARRPPPRHRDGSQLGLAIIALGKLGGGELNYSSDIDLLFVAENVEEVGGGRTQAAAAAADEYFQRLAQMLIRILSESTPQGIAYRVDMRLRPHGQQGPLVVTYADALNYYDAAGRTWERQVFVKARAIAGDVDLGRRLIEALQPWIYRRYLMRADITGIAALKRRIEQRAQRAGDDDRNVKDGHGGLRDVEYVIQFLQLLNGGDTPRVRCTGTLEAIRRLHAVQCLTAEEQLALDENYQFLRRIEHYLQIMYDRKTHCLPSEPVEFRKVALRMGYRDQAEQPAEEVFREELARRTTLNRRVLDHLLHDAFELQEASSPESDLILDPEPPPEAIDAALTPYRFADPQGAYRRLQQMAVESIPFLSSRRSRHFLAAIAPRLLAAIAETPNPDATIVSLANIAESLGGKAVLWELFSANPPSMTLCIRLCAGSPYLTSILTSNPGMIDELLDSLMLDTLPDREALANSLQELCRNAVDIAPILHSFKNSMHLRVGVRDILGKDTIARTHQALSDIAEVCMEQLIEFEFHRLLHQLGLPTCQITDGSGKSVEVAAELVVLAVGKLGGREPNYHSDLDVIFLFDGEGTTKSIVPSRRFEATTNRHFFNQLSQRVIQAATRIGNTGRLFEVDVRLRPLGRSGELAITIDDLRLYFSGGGGQVWERQALCKARPIWGSPQKQQMAMDCVREVLTCDDWSPDMAQKIFDHRRQLEQGASASNLKRGVGGTMDVEFVAQLLQLAGASQHPQVLVPGTLDALEALMAAGCLERDVGTELHQHYQFLRSIESAIRLMNMSARHEIPADLPALEQLAFLLNGRRADKAIDGLAVKEQCQHVRQRCRELYSQIFAAWLPNVSSEPVE